MPTKTPKSKEAQLSDTWRAVRQLKEIYGSEEAMKRDYPPIHRRYLAYKQEVEQLRKEVAA